jgi:hypothetical protein
MSCGGLELEYVGLWESVLHYSVTALVGGGDVE